MPGTTISDRIYRAQPGGPPSTPGIEGWALIPAWASLGSLLMFLANRRRPLILAPPGVALLERGDDPACGYWRLAEWDSEQSLANWNPPVSVNQVTVAAARALTPPRFASFVEQQTRSHMARLRWLAEVQEPTTAAESLAARLADDLQQELAAAFPPVARGDMRDAIAQHLHSLADDLCDMPGSARAVAGAPRLLRFAGDVTRSLHDDDERLYALARDTTLDPATREWRPGPRLGDVIRDFIARCATNPQIDQDDQRIAINLLDQLVKAAEDQCPEPNPEGGTATATERLRELRREHRTSEGSDDLERDSIFQDQPAAPHTAGRPTSGHSTAGHRPSHLDVVDAMEALLLAESAGRLLHVGHVAQFEGPPPAFESLIERVALGLDLIPRARQKVVHPRAGLGPPRWIDDTAFHIEHHVHRTALPHPGDRELLQQFAARVFAEPLDHAKPLWRLWLVEGLANNGFAIVVKVHLPVISGASGGDLISVVYDFHRHYCALEAAPEWFPQSEPSSTNLVARTLGETAMSALALPFHFARFATHPQHVAAHLRDALEEVGTMTLGTGRAPDSPVNVAIGSDRRVAFVDAHVPAIKTVKNAFGCTADDVVLAAVAGGFRTWMLSRRLPAEKFELEVSVVSAPPSETESDAGWMSQTSEIIAPLPVQEPDPLTRLRLVHDARVKAAHHPIRREAIHCAVAQAGPLPITGLMTRAPLSARTSNVLVATIPGWPMELYLLGRRMTSMHPVAFLLAQRAMAIATMPYDQSVHFGLIGDYDQMYDIEAVATGITDAIDELVSLAQEQRPFERQPPARSARPLRFIAPTQMRSQSMPVV